MITVHLRVIGTKEVCDNGAQAHDGERDGGGSHSGGRGCAGRGASERLGGHGLGYGELVALRGALKFDLLVLAAVRRHERARMLEVLALGVAPQRQDRVAL